MFNYEMKYFLISCVGEFILSIKSQPTLSSNWFVYPFKIPLHPQTLLFLTHLHFSISQLHFYNNHFYLYFCSKLLLYFINLLLFLFLLILNHSMSIIIIQLILNMKIVSTDYLSLIALLVLCVSATHNIYFDQIPIPANITHLTNTSEDLYLQGVVTKNQNHYQVFLYEHTSLGFRLFGKKTVCQPLSFQIAENPILSYQIVIDCVDNNYNDTTNNTTPNPNANCTNQTTYSQNGRNITVCGDLNTVSNDGCSEHCQIEYCGDGIKQDFQECDDSDNDSGDGCSHNCSLQIIWQPLPVQQILENNDNYDHKLQKQKIGDEKEKENGPYIEQGIPKQIIIPLIGLAIFAIFMGRKDILQKLLEGGEQKKEKEQEIENKEEYEFMNTNNEWNKNKLKYIS